MASHAHYMQETYHGALIPKTYYTCVQSKGYGAQYLSISHDHSPMVEEVDPSFNMGLFPERNRLARLTLHR